MTNKPSETGTFDLCILRPAEECRACRLADLLGCRFDLKKLLRFVSAYFFIIFAGSAALIVNGMMQEFYFYLAVMVLFSLIFFEFWEIRILCSHCPFYAEGKKVLHCCANYGSLKVWKYRPGPMSTSEKVQLLAGFILLVAILLLPSAIMVVHRLYLWALPPVLGLMAFGYVLNRFHCSECVNFSCPFNTVPSDIVDEFLKRNPAMEKAWRKRA